MILALLACAPPATLWPTDDCRVADTLPIAGEVRCSGPAGEVSAAFAPVEIVEVGGDQGEAWSGLSWWAAGPPAGGGEIAVGWRPGELGIAVETEALSLAVGFTPRGGAVVPGFVSVREGDVTCDAETGAGTVSLTGLPTGWADGDVWTSSFGGGAPASTTVAASWEAPWSSGCALDPRAWSTVRVRSICAGQVRAEIQFLAPDTWDVTLDTVGQVETVDAEWHASFDASCDGAVAGPYVGSLTGSAGALALSTPLVDVATNGDGAWYLTGTTCGTCEDWSVEVEGLPEL